MDNTVYINFYTPRVHYKRVVDSCHSYGAHSLTLDIISFGGKAGDVLSTVEIKTY